MLTDRQTDGQTDRQTSSIHKPELLCNPPKMVMIFSKPTTSMSLRFTPVYTYHFYVSALYTCLYLPLLCLCALHLSKPTTSMSLHFTPVYGATKTPCQ